MERFHCSSYKCALPTYSVAWCSARLLDTASYYNNISGLHEVFRLRHNAALKELDLRLNPVTKEEPDYRLFVVHMLVHLRTLGELRVGKEGWVGGPIVTRWSRVDL